MRIHLDRSKDLGNFVELEGVATADSDLAAELERVARLTRGARRSTPSGSCATPTPTRCVGSERAGRRRPRAVMERAHAPYSRYRVGAALRAEDGSIHVGANVENAAYPQGQCAEASAIGALIAAGLHARSPRSAVIADGEDFCVPCGGCRQRLREFMPPAPRSTCCADSGARQTTTLDALLPRSFGPEFLPG